MKAGEGAKRLLMDIAKGWLEQGPQYLRCFPKIAPLCVALACKCAACKVTRH
jgi:hypothetical protein